MTNHKGMTLIEVMVALAIFAVAALSITNSLGQLMSNMPILQERTYAQWVADNVLVDAVLENKQQFLAIGKKEGDTEMAGERWYWRREIIKTQSDDFRMVKVSVSDDSRYDRILTQVNTYVFKVK
ncbi:type II secretion system protein GspI [Parashewanella curva]|uniref:Type II secretion system protein I n=1 Tax=Parashewanella curva TaxID=2338552 RepID=A0A3L8Q037_9GAMM|nr:type II secretion system minor pseudopilin GspI [Parashewanella curva]RLV60780.1 type II secretion system protein GspI [Parashewanella curva]